MTHYSVQPQDDATSRDIVNRSWSRRHWLVLNGSALATVALPSIAAAQSSSPVRRVADVHRPRVVDTPLVPANPEDRIDAAAWEAISERAVDAARSAGAQYADARLTRTLQQTYHPVYGTLESEVLRVAVGVRALVNGFWGFSADTELDPDTVARTARSAVEQAKTVVGGSARTVDMGSVPIARGRWETPVEIDPFTVSHAEKGDFLSAWWDQAAQAGVPFDLRNCGFACFERQERVVATTEGSLFTQTVFDTDGRYAWNGGAIRIESVNLAGKGWELFLHGGISEAILALRDQVLAAQSMPAKPATIGRTTLVCDGYTMASMLEQTIGIATQLDRALGYESNANGTSFITDPLAMLGQMQITAPGITITANRNTPTQLGTVKWDDEGVEPQPFTLVKNGVLNDMQTTREQAAWLAPYYSKAGLPVRSHGCAAADDASSIILQHMPNLAFETRQSNPSLDDLVAGVTDGILLSGASAEIDAQARNGILWMGSMRKIKNGRLGAPLSNGSLAVSFNTLDFWKKISAYGGPATVRTASFTPWLTSLTQIIALQPPAFKGQPIQATRHSMTAPAAVVANQPLIDLSRRA